MRKVNDSTCSIGQLFLRVTGVVCGLGAMIPMTTIAAPWEFGAILDIGVTHTDNIFLANDGLEESETVYSIVPELFLTTDGERLTADLRYRAEAYFYADNGYADKVFHSLDASLTSVLIRERLFVDLTATNYQSIITPEGQFPTSNLPITGNRVDSLTLAARPYWQQRVGQADLLLEASYIDTEYDDDSISSQNLRRGRFRLDNIQRQQGFAWGLGYDYLRMEYENSIPWEFQRAALDLGFWISGTTRIFVVGGAETSFDNTFEANLDQDFWEAGFQYRPNQRLNLELAVGDRSYGTSFRGSFSYTLRRGDVRISYAEGPSTRGALSFGRRPIADTDNLDSFLDQPGSSDRFVRRRGEISTNIELSKSDLTLRIFAERRELRSTADGVPLDDEEYAGAAIRWNWKFGTKTTFGIGTDVSKRDRSGRTDDLLRMRVNLAYNLTQRMSIRLEGVHARQNGQDSSAFDYKENQLRLLVRTEF